VIIGAVGVENGLTPASPAPPEGDWGTSVTTSPVKEFLAMNCHGEVGGPPPKDKRLTPASPPASGSPATTDSPIGGSAAGSSPAGDFPPASGST
jgi:hypothetical protein